MKNILIFLAGAGVGAGTTWFLVKRYYEKRADDEINDVVTRFKRYKKVMDDIEEEHNENPNCISGGNNVDTNEENIRADYNEELSNGIIDDPKGEKDGTAPYLISEEEFGELEDYDQKTLFWYYRDNILATDEDLEVEDKFTTVGDALEEFKKDRYVERVLVRNEQDETDYEILISEKHFYEVTGGDTE